MSSGIIKIIDKKYPDLDEECIDILHLKNICDLYKKKKDTTTDSVSLSKINIISPDFKNAALKNIDNKKRINILKTTEFKKKKYSFFIKIIYSCLKINVIIFNLNNDTGTITLKNNYQLIRSIDHKKKQLIDDHMRLLKLHYKNSLKPVPIEYDDYIRDYVLKLKILDKIKLFW